MRAPIFLSAVLGLLLLMPLPHSANARLAPPVPELLRMPLVSQAGGTSRTVALQGQYAYLGVGPRMLVLDVEDVAQPTVVGWSPILAAEVFGIAMAGDYVYVLADHLMVFDVSDPAHPVQVGAAIQGGMAIAVDGNRAYQAWGANLLVFDVTDPRNPLPLGSAPLPIGFYATGVAIQGTYAYLSVSGPGGLIVVDVADPAHPTVVGSCAVPGGNWTTVAVAGDYAYVTAGSAGLRVINVATPSAPVEVGFLDTAGQALGVAVAGNYTYLGDGDNGLRVIDVANPAAPVEVGAIDTPGAPWNPVLSGRYAYVPDTAGLRVIDVQNPALLAETGAYLSPYGADFVTVAGAMAYITTIYGGTYIADLADLNRPRVMGYYDLPGYNYKPAVMGSYLYAPNGAAGLRVLDVSNPAHPVEVGFYDTPDFAGSVVLSGTLAFVGDSSSMQILDVSNPVSPTLAGTYPANVPNGGASVAAVQGHYAYLDVRLTSTNFYELRIVDVLDPANPVLAGTHPIGPEIIRDTIVSGPYAYLATSFGLRIIDISNPGAPAQVSSLSTVAFDLAIDDTRLYVASATSGLKLFDVTNPALPQLVTTCSVPGIAGDVELAGNLAYIAADEAGMSVCLAAQWQTYLPFAARNP